MSLRYALVTPARDEADNLRRLAGCVLAQTARPERWIVVDNGSHDETAAVVRELAAAQPWVELRAVPAAPSYNGALQDGSEIRAFHSGLAALGRPPDVVVKLDADVSFEPDHFERLLAAFEAEPRLGIAGGTCLELEDGEWREIRVTGGHVRGAVRAYRWTCLEQLLPLPERLGWDGLDEAGAAVRGWTARIVPSLAFHHHRRVGARDGARHRRWLAQGRAAHYMGYRLPYLFVRTLYRARVEPAALAMLWGYGAAALRREPRYADRAVRARLREAQRLRRLPLRMREATGRR